MTPHAPTAALAALVLPLLTTPAAAQLTDSAATAFGRQYVRWLLVGPADSLSGAMTTAARDRVGGVAGIRQREQALRDRAGAEVALEREAVLRLADTTRYLRTLRFAKWPVPGTIQWDLDPQGRILAGYVELPAAGDDPQ